MNQFTKLAMMIPMSAIMRRLPNRVKSVLVVYPTTAIIANVAAVMTKTWAMLDIVYTKNMLLKDMPMMPLKAKNKRVNEVDDQR